MINIENPYLVSNAKLEQIPSPHPILFMEKMSELTQKIRSFVQIFMEKIFPTIKNSFVI